MLEFAGGNILNRNKYLGSPPWSFVHTLSQDGARVFLRKVRRVAFQYHDLVAQQLMNAHGDHIQQVADGGQ
eukprot:8529759-Pyramimonas_sp.AAC.1